MLNILFWLIFGILGGWITVLVAEPEAPPRCVVYGVSIGALGGFIGGALGRIVHGLPLVGSLDFNSIFLAVIFSIGSTAIFHLIIMRQK